MIDKYLQFLHDHDGYFYEWIPHIMKKDEKWEFYLKNGVWTIGLYKGNNIKVIPYTDIMSYCQSNHLDLYSLESLLHDSILMAGMAKYQANETNSLYYSKICDLIGEELIIKSLKNFEEQFSKIIDVLNKPKLSLV